MNLLKELVLRVKTLLGIKPKSVDLNHTYSESKGKEPINWDKRLCDLEKHLKGQIKLSDTTLKEWTSDSLNWVTCACGNTCSIIPRTSGGIPLDGELSSLGTSFYAAVTNITGEVGPFYNPTAELERARHILHRIEERSTVLINTILNKELKK